MNLPITLNSEGYKNNKFLLRSIGLFCIVSIQRNTIIIKKYGIENAITIDRILQAPAMQENAPTDRTPPSDSLIDKSQDDNSIYDRLFSLVVQRYILA